MGHGAFALGTRAALGALLVLGSLAAGAGAESGAGSVSGTVRLTGAAPKSRLIDMSADPNCRELAGRKVPSQEVVAGRRGELANVFVRLEGEGLAAAAGPPPEQPVVIEQRGCIYYPRMAGARVGQTLKVINGDEVIHNVRSVSEAGSDFNIGQPYAGMEFDFELEAPEPMLRLRCDMHPWMHAFIGVVTHRWFAVTGEDGRYELAGVPPGTYELVLWHESFGTLRQAVTIAGGTELSLDLAFPAGADG